MLQSSKKKKSDVDTIFSSFSTLDSFVTYRHVNLLALIKSEITVSLNCEQVEGRARYADRYTIGRNGSVLTIFAAFSDFIREIGECQVDRRPLRQMRDRFRLRRHDLQPHRRVFPRFQQNSIGIIRRRTVTLKLHLSMRLFPALSSLFSPNAVRRSFYLAARVFHVFAT